MPIPKAYQTIFEETKGRAFIGECLSKKKLRRFIQFQETVPTSRLKKRHQRAKDNGWKPPTKKKRAQTELLLSERLKMLDNDPELCSLLESHSDIGECTASELSSTSQASSVEEPHVPHVGNSNQVESNQDASNNNKHIQGIMHNDKQTDEMHSPIRDASNFNGEMSAGYQQDMKTSTEHVVRSTEHVVRSTEHGVRSTEHVGRSTEHVGRSTEHVGISTEHVVRSTEHVVRSTEHVVSSSDTEGIECHHQSKDDRSDVSCVEITGNGCNKSAETEMDNNFPELPNHINEISRPIDSVHATDTDKQTSSIEESQQSITIPDIPVKSSSCTSLEGEKTQYFTPLKYGFMGTHIGLARSTLSSMDEDILCGDGNELLAEPLSLTLSSADYSSVFETPMQDNRQIQNSGEKITNTAQISMCSSLGNIPGNIPSQKNVSQTSDSLSKSKLFDSSQESSQNESFGLNSGIIMMNLASPYLSDSLTSSHGSNDSKDSLSLQGSTCTRREELDHDGEVIDNGFNKSYKEMLILDCPPEMSQERKVAASEARAHQLTAYYFNEVSNTFYKPSKSTSGINMLVEKKFDIKKEAKRIHWSYHMVQLVLYDSDISFDSLDDTQEYIQNTTQELSQDHSLDSTRDHSLGLGSTGNSTELSQDHSLDSTRDHSLGSTQNSTELSHDHSLGSTRDSTELSQDHSLDSTRDHSLDSTWDHSLDSTWDHSLDSTRDSTELSQDHSLDSTQDITENYAQGLTDGGSRNSASDNRQDASKDTPSVSTKILKHEDPTPSEAGPSTQDGIQDCIQGSIHSTQGSIHSTQGSIHSTQDHAQHGDSLHDYISLTGPPDRKHDATKLYKCGDDTETCTQLQDGAEDCTLDMDSIENCTHDKPRNGTQDCTQDNIEDCTQAYYSCSSLEDTQTCSPYYDCTESPL